YNQLTSTTRTLLKKFLTSQIRENKKKEWLHVKATKRKNKFQSFNNVDSKLKKLRIDRDEKLIENQKENFFRDLQPFIELGSSDLIVHIPREFTFSAGYANSIRAIKRFGTSMYEYAGYQITLDFSACKIADTSALFVLQIVKLEFLEKLSILQTRLSAVNIIPEIKIIPPTEKDVIRLLMVCGFQFDHRSINVMEGESTLNPINAMGYYKGTKSQKHYLENRKGACAKTVVNYLDDCLKHHQYQLTDDEKQDIDGIIGEILNNAEDHSGKNTWFMTANFSKELFNMGDEEIGEMNLTIMNFGNTIYEAFQNTKDDNINMYADVCNYVHKIHSENGGKIFSEEELFVLATMQDQVSRLKYEEPSRGTGTMRFINSFLKLGDYENKGKNFKPNLSIFSGNVQLTCDNVYKPFSKADVFCLSLNPEEDLNKPPAFSHLKKISEKFPGTLLSVKIYINKAHYDKKYGGNGNGKI
ncbi:hypothetical protein, partial [Pedobacter sp.]|uniref:hypothetical protein n=1 Tax=Pedobacter sp. TaxID=1411316 RepID=UPI003D7FA25A